MGKDGVIGVILHLSEESIHRLLHGKNVYAGFLPEDSGELDRMDRAFFYGGDSSRSLEGEAIISGIAYETPDRVLQRGDRLFLTKEEFEKYAAESERVKSGKMLVLELEDAVKYVNSVKCPFSVPVEGKYVTKEIFEGIVRANR